MACETCPLEDRVLIALEVARDNRGDFLARSEKIQAVTRLTAKADIISRVMEECEQPEPTTAICPNQELAEDVYNMLFPAEVSSANLEATAESR